MAIENEALYLRTIKEKLGEKRYYHSLCVADSCRALCVRYGGDADRMYAAGLLHDVMKEADAAETRYFCRKYGIELSALEKAAPKLWHAVTGAVFVREVLGLHDAPLLQAIRYHTTGRRGMTQEEKILFVADFISADRDYPDVDVIRRKAERSLEDAMLYGVQYTVRELLDRAAPIHPDTLELYNELILNETDKMSEE